MPFHEQKGFEGNENQHAVVFGGVLGLEIVTRVHCVRHLFIQVHKTGITQSIKDPCGSSKSAIKVLLSFILDYFIILDHFIKQGDLILFIVQVRFHHVKVFVIGILALIARDQVIVKVLVNLMQIHRNACLEKQENVS